MEQMTGLNFVEGDYDVFEEGYVFFSEWNCESWNDACENIEQLGRSVEFEGFVDETVEAIVDSFADHFSPRD